MDQVYGQSQAMSTAVVGYTHSHVHSTAALLIHPSADTVAHTSSSAHYPVRVDRQNPSPTSPLALRRQPSGRFAAHDPEVVEDQLGEEDTVHYARCIRRSGDPSDHHRKR